MVQRNLPLKGGENHESDHEHPGRGCVLGAWGNIPGTSMVPRGVRHGRIVCACGGGVPDVLFPSCTEGAQRHLAPLSAREFN